MAENPPFQFNETLTSYFTQPSTSPSRVLPWIYTGLFPPKRRITSTIARSDSGGRTSCSTIGMFLCYPVRNFTGSGPETSALGECRVRTRRGNFKESSDTARVSSYSHMRRRSKVETTIPSSCGSRIIHSNLPRAKANIAQRQLIGFRKPIVLRVSFFGYQNS